MLVFGLLLATSALAQILAGAVGPTTLGFAVFAIAFLILGSRGTPAIRNRLARRHSLGQFGRRQTVDRRVIETDEQCREDCVVCDSVIESGVVRRFREEYVVAGVPVSTRSLKYNHYCLGCVAEERGWPVEADTGALAEKEAETREFETKEWVTETERD